MMRESSEPLIGNAQFEGFCVDLLEEIAQQVGFQYEIRLVPDTKYGAPDKDGNWNGMVKQLLDKVYSKNIPRWGGTKFSIKSITII